MPRSLTKLAYNFRIKLELIHKISTKRTRLLKRLIFITTQSSTNGFWLFWSEFNTKTSCETAINPTWGDIRSKSLITKERLIKTTNSNRKSRPFLFSWATKTSTPSTKTNYQKTKSSKCWPKRSSESTSSLLMASIFVSKRITSRDRRKLEAISSYWMKKIKKCKTFISAFTMKKSSKTLGFL